MNASEIFAHICELERKNEELNHKRELMVDVQRFEAVTLTAEEVAKLHGVTVATVRNYVKHGLIYTHPNSTDAKMLFYASSALLYDFKGELKRAKAAIKYGSPRVSN